ncbi:MAG: hypothetical protein Q7S33_01605 [Nanoarchaeota archaeon]|nr:hypothetical protein [Nanoarchaeota archaeon]
MPTNADLIRKQGNKAVGQDAYLMMILGPEGMVFQKELSFEFMNNFKKRPNLLSLENKVFSEVQFKDISKDNQNVLELIDYPAKYEEMAHNYHKLREENFMLKTKSMGYGKHMDLYSSYLKKSENNENQFVGEIAKMLSGNYRGTIENVKNNQEGDKDSPYLWKWDDRINAVKQFYKMNQDKSQDKEKIDILFSILCKNKYASKKYSDKISELKELFNS